MQSIKEPPTLTTSEFVALTPAAEEMVPCEEWGGLRSHSEDDVELAVVELFKLLTDCSKPHAQLIDDVNSYNLRKGK